MKTSLLRPLAALALLAALTGCGTSFDPTVEGSGGGEERAGSSRCSACLGSGKARYLSGKTKNSYSEPACSRCGGSGWEN